MSFRRRPAYAPAEMKAVAIVGGVAVVIALFVILSRFQRRRRRRFIEARYEFPPALSDKLRKHHPRLREDEVPQVLDGLRQWFVACLYAGGEMIGMPSRVVDDAWHEFILMTRAYTEFCEKAFGKYLHHTPNVLAPEPIAPTIPKTLDLLRKAEVVGLGGMPVLFTIDSDLRIERAGFGGEDCLGGGDQDSGDGCSCGD
jgi:hypothetical protein